MKKIITSLGLLGMILCGSPAKANNIVFNPGFESGLAGWTLSTTNPVQWFVDTVSNSGSNDIANQCVGTTCLDPVTGSYFYQDLVTLPGQVYDLSFWAFFESGINQVDEIKVTWGGITALDIINPPVADDVYTQYGALSLTATSPTTRLQFFGRDDPGMVGVDDIAVIANPEPSTFLLISGGLLIFAGRRWHLLRQVRVTSR